MRALRIILKRTRKWKRANAVVAVACLSLIRPAIRGGGWLFVAVHQEATETIAIASAGVVVGPKGAFSYNL